MTKYQKLVEFIVKNVGGKENILSVTHCMTRLRFTLKDDQLVNEEAFLTATDILTAQYAGGRYQVVVGTHVAEVFKEMQQLLGLQTEEVGEGEKGGVNRLIEIITKVITPVLGILTASGLLQGILALLTVTNVLSETDGAYIILHAMGQTTFYFLPVVLGYTSAKAFKLNPFVGMILGATLVIPELMGNLITEDALYTLFEGTLFATPVHNTFFGIPILFPANGYQYSVIPIIFITFLGAKVEKFLKRVIPELLSHNLTAFLTILITFPLSILIVGPITNVLSSLISAGVSSLYAISPVLTSVVVGTLYQPLVIFGLHWPMSAIGINNLAQTGVDYIFPMSFTANFAQTAVVLAVFLKTRSKQQKTLAIPAMISGLFCIIEPAIYGFSLPVKKRFAFSMIGGAVGSLILAVFSAKMYAFAFGVLGFVSFINPETGSFSGLIVAVMASLAAMIVTFSLTYFTFKEEEELEEPKKAGLIRPEAIVAPLEGQLQNIEFSQDPSFSAKALGEGVVILPVTDQLTAPITGEIVTIFPGGHAIGLLSESGVEVLIHVGIDTVELKGVGFEVIVEKGQRVQQGQQLAKLDLASIKAAGYSTETVVVITNTSEFLTVLPESQQPVKIGNKIMTVIPFNQEATNNNKKLEVSI